MSKVRFAPTAGTHRHRVHAAIEHARAGATPKTDDVASRWLAGIAAFGDRDGARVLALLRDDSRRVRGVALKTAPHACDDAAATTALHSAWELRAERGLLRAFRREGRTAGIDAFLDGLVAAGQLRDLVDDLPFGSEAAVRRQLAHALERPSRRFWDGLALGHPGVLAEVLVARWREHAGEADAVTRQLTARHHARLAERVPDHALALAELLLARAIEPTPAVWTELLRRRTEPTVELAIRFASRVPAGVFARRVRELPAPVLGRIVAQAPALLGAFGPKVRVMTPDRQRALAEGWLAASARFPAEGTHLLRYLPAGAARDEAYARWSLAARDRDGVIDRDAIAALPIELAAREAHRHVLEVTALAIDPVRRLGQIYGLRRALFGMVPDRALALLADAPMHKVTVAKEVVRLSGELRASGAFARLDALASGKLHRDVRIALLRALWDHLDRDRTWELFERAVEDPDWVVASRLADIPADRLTVVLDERLSALLARVLARPEPEARIALLGRAGQLALVDRGKTLLAACRALLRSVYDAEVRAAMTAVLARSQEVDIAALEGAFDALRDDPRALHVAAAALCAHDIRSRDSWKHAARALEHAAMHDARWGVIAVQAAGARGLPDDVIAAITGAAERDALDLDATLAAINAMRGLRNEDLGAAVAALAASPHAGARRVAVDALAHDARAGRGWTAERLALLAQLRADPVAAVAGAAARVWPPREQDPAFT